MCEGRKHWTRTRSQKYGIIKVIEIDPAEELLYRESESYVSHHKTSKHRRLTFLYVNMPESTQSCDG